MVLKNLYTQFRDSGLRMTIALVMQNAPSRASLQNAIRDLGMGDIKVSKPRGNDTLIRPTTRFVAPDGSIVSEWQDFVGPAELGLAVRAILGQPLYSQMASGVQ